jgi:formylglycine-generating enzyme required for sulfatase activity
LSEAEWEFAAKAGGDADAIVTEGPRGFCGAINGADSSYHRSYPGDRFVDTDCDDGYPATSPAGSFAANAFGLYDVEGNVNQWVEDCYHPTYDGAPTDGSAWRENVCKMGVVRGGAWTDDPRYLASFRRGSGDMNARFSANGIRVARNL